MVNKINNTRRIRSAFRRRPTPTVRMLRGGAAAYVATAVKVEVTKAEADLAERLAFIMTDAAERRAERAAINKVVDALRKQARRAAHDQHIKGIVAKVDTMRRLAVTQSEVRTAPLVSKAGWLYADRMTAVCIGFEDVTKDVTELLALITAARGGEAPKEFKGYPLAHMGLEGKQTDEAKDQAMAATLRKQIVDLNATHLILNTGTRIATETQAAIMDMVRERKLIVLYSGVQSAIAMTLDALGKFDGVNGVAGIKELFDKDEFYRLAAGDIVDGLLPVIDPFGNTVLNIKQDGFGWLFDGHRVKTSNAVLVAEPRFAAGGDTFLATLDDYGFVRFALAMLQDAMLSSGHAPVKDVIFRWLKGLEMGLVQSEKGIGATLHYNRHNVLGSVTVSVDAHGSLRPSAVCHTAGVIGQLLASGTDAVYVPAPKSDFLIGHSWDDIRAGKTPWSITADGLLTLACKGTKHLDAFYAQVTGYQTVETMIMAATPFCQGGAMPISDELLKGFFNVEKKTLVNATRRFTDKLQRSKAKEGWAPAVNVGDVVRPGDVLATVNGHPLKLTKQKVKDATAAVITEVSFEETTRHGRPSLELIVRADVVYEGEAKGRMFGKAMFAGAAASRFKMFVLDADGKPVEFTGAFLSDGIVKVSNSFTKKIRKRREAVGMVRQECEPSIFETMQRLYGVHGKQPDGRFSFETVDGRHYMTITDKVWIADVDVFVESSPVHEALGDSSLMLTQVSTLATLDPVSHGAGSAILEDLLGKIVDAKSERLRYALANSAVFDDEITVKLNSGELKAKKVKGYVERNPDRTHGQVVRFATTADAPPAQRGDFDINATDVEILEAKRLEGDKVVDLLPNVIIVRVDDEDGVSHVVSLNRSILLALSGRNDGGALGGVGHTAAEIIRATLWKSEAGKFGDVSKMVGLLNKFRRQLRKLAHSASLNRLFKGPVGVSAKVVPSFATPQGVIEVRKDGAAAQFLARKFGCKVDELEGKAFLGVRHPVAAVGVFRVKFNNDLSRNVVMMNAEEVRTRFFGDFDGDTFNFFPIRQVWAALSLEAGINAMIPGGDIHMLVTGTAGVHPGHELFGELVENKGIAKLLDKTSAPASLNEWIKKLDEQAHTAVATCGSSYQMLEFAVYLSGLGFGNAQAFLLCASLYENRGLAGGITSDALKKALSMWNNCLGESRNTIADFRKLLEEDLSDKKLPRPVRLKDDTYKALALASEIKAVAKNGGLKRLTRNGEVDVVDYIGGLDPQAYEVLWPIVAMLQAMGRGRVFEAFDALIAYTPELSKQVDSIGLQRSFLYKMVLKAANTFRPVAVKLKEHDLLKPEEAVVVNDDNAWDEAEVGEFEALDYADNVWED